MVAGEWRGPAINVYGPNESLALTLTLFTEQEGSGGHGVAQPLLWVLAGEPGLGWPWGSTQGGLHGVMEQVMGSGILGLRKLLWSLYMSDLVYYLCVVLPYSPSPPSKRGILSLGSCHQAVLSTERWEGWSRGCTGGCVWDQS